MLNFDKMLNPLRGYMYEAQGSDSGGGFGSSDRGDSSNRDTSDRNDNNRGGDGGRGDGNDSSNSFGSDTPTANDFDNAFNDFGQDTSTGFGYDPQRDNQFSVSAGTSFGGFGGDQSSRDNYGQDYRVDASYGGGLTASEGFASSFGSDSFSYTGTKERAVPKDIRSFSEKVQGFFGYEVPKFFDEFKAAPLDTLSDVLSNPFVGGAAALLGGGIAVAGVRTLDAVMDAFQGEQSMVDAAKQAFSSAIASPMGAPLGALQGVAAKVAANPENIGTTIAGFAGGNIGGTVGQAIGASFGNPYTSAIGGAVGAFAGTKGALDIASRATGNAARRADGLGSESSPEQIANEQQSDRNRESPLVANAPKPPRANATAYARQVDIERFNPQQSDSFNPYVGDVYRG